uniref:hypothetical protein n=1 Tax=Roseovarius sp. BRH_c41 TaxID=1629709 RepID=UPI0005F24720|nr:hypothetical protein [Roseovarius sp. BRH_c41]
MTHRHRSTGEMISTLCFIGVGFWCLGTALDAPQPKSALLILCAFASLAGSARHLIARAFERT